MENNPTVITGNLFTDDRGTLGFVNEFKFDKVKRFYTVTNHSKNFIRAWHGHKQEAKYVTVVSGCALVAVTPLSSFDVNKEKAPEVTKYVLTDNKPTVVYIPPGYANGFMSLTDNTIMIYFSAAEMGEFTDDDVRFPYNEIPGVWEITPR